MPVSAIVAAEIVMLAAGVYVVPYFFPPSGGMLSASTLAGFNNTVSYLAFAVFAGLVAITLRSRADASTFAPRLLVRPLFGKPPLIVVLVMLGHAALFGGLYAVKHGLVFAEALYFQDAAYRALAGAVPFVDYAFFYGPLMLYPPVLAGSIMNLPAAYAVVYIGTYLLGLYLLYTVLSALVEDRSRVTRWFVVFSIGFFCPIAGLNYTFVRFLLPTVAVMAGWRWLRLSTAGHWVLATLLTSAATLYSPDMGIVTTVALGVMALLQALRDGSVSGGLRRLLAGASVPAVALALAAALMLLIDGTWRPLQAFASNVVTFSAGGWNTQVDPSLPTLALLGLTLVVVVWLFAIWRSTDGARNGDLAAAYAVMLVVMQRASFGKADVEHIAYSGLPIFLGAAAWTTRPLSTSRQTLWIAAAVFVGVVLPLQWYHAMLFVPSLATRFRPVEVAPAGVSAPPSAPRTTADVQASIANAVEHFGADRTYYMHQLEYYRLPVYLKYRLKPFMYYPLLAAAFTDRDINAMISALRSSDAIVLVRRPTLSLEPPRMFKTQWPFYVASAPLPGSTVFNLTLDFQWRLFRPLTEFLMTSYTTEFADGDIVGLRLRRDRAPLANALQ